MAFYKHSQPVLLSQDSDSGLSVPSGTLRSTLTFNGETPRLAEEDHERLIQSLLQRTGDSSTGYSYQNNLPSSTPKKSETLADSYLQSTRASSPDMFSKTRRSPFLYNRQASGRFGSSFHGDILNTSMDRLSASFVGDNYLNGGLQNALSESQTRRGALLEKLKDAQDTLQLQSARLSKMETEYHSSSYQVEELKANETKLLRQLAELEQQKQELNDLRMKDLDMQLTLQDRIKELENGLRNMATDFQLIEADHARRKELVDQLSTTVELVEEENRKLHKISLRGDIEDWIVEHSINTEVQCLRKEIASALEEKESYKTQLDGQRRESKHWRQENEQQRKLLKDAQETTSELKVKLASLTHKLEESEAKEKELVKNNEEMKVKEREIQNTLTDLRSRVAITTSDKERLYQEKLDLNAKVENTSLHNKQLEEEVKGLQLAAREYSHDMEVKDNSLSQLSNTNKQLTEELAGSQRVGETLSVELTKTKESLDRCEEEMSHIRSELERVTEAKQKLAMQHKNSEMELNKLQTENEYSVKTLSKEKRELQQELDKLKDKLREQTKENNILEEKISSLNQKLSVSQELSAQQIAQLESGVKLWKEKNENTRASLDRKDEEIANLTRKMAEYESQIHVLMREKEAKQLEYDKYINLQDENQRLTLLNRRVTQENAETEQMVQLLQTQRDIYARSVQEYTSKVLHADQISEENRQLQTTIENLRASQSTLEDELNSIKELKQSRNEEIQTLNITIKELKSELEERKQERDKLEQENAVLKNSVQENYQLKQQLQTLQADLNVCKADKSVIHHLTSQNISLSNQLQEVKDELASVSKENSSTSLVLSQSKQIEAKQIEEINYLQEGLKTSEKLVVELRKRAQEAESNLHQSELARANLNSQLTKSKGQAERIQEKLEEQQTRLAEAGVAEDKCKQLQQKIKELSVKAHEYSNEKDSLLSRQSKLELEVQIATHELEGQKNTNRQLTSDLSMSVKEKNTLQNEITKLEQQVAEMTRVTDSKMKALQEKLGKAEETNLSNLQRMQFTGQELLESRSKHTLTSSELQEKSDEINSLRQLSDALKLDLREATDLNARQETLISTLKEETSVLSEVGAELTELKRKCKDLSQLNEEQGQTISNLKKEAEQKEQLQKNMNEIGADLVTVKNELQKTYASMAQKELEMERLQQLYNNSVLDAENSEEKYVELKIRLDQAEKAREVAVTTFQDKIHCLETEIYSYKTEILKLEQQVAELKGRLSSASNELSLTNDISVLDKESLATVKAERDGLAAECSHLRSQNTKQLSAQSQLETEKRNIQVQFKEAKIDMFKIEKEKENLERANSRLDSSVRECNRLLTSLTAEYEVARNKLAEFERANEKMKKENCSLKEEVSELLESVGEKEKLHTRIGQLTNQVSDLKAKLREIDFQQARTSATLGPIINRASLQDKFEQAKLALAPTLASKELTNFGQISSDSLPSQLKSSHAGTKLETNLSFLSANDDLLAESRMNHSSAEVVTDSSGGNSEDNSLADQQTQPELSDTLSSSKPNNTIERVQQLTKGDEISGSQSPFRVQEIPVTITVEDANCLSTSAEDVTLSDNNAADYTLTVEQEVETDSEEEEEVDQLCASSGPSLTRDKTMKIFKQLKKAKQKSKKCLAPTPRINKSLPDLPKETRMRTNSFEQSDSKFRGDDDSVVESTDVGLVKEDIMAKSGRVEWRGDPREAHRRYLSSCDLSVIADTEEVEQDGEEVEQDGEEIEEDGEEVEQTFGEQESASLVESEDSVSSEFTRSLLNLPSASHTGSSDSLPSVGVTDSPQFPRSSEPPEQRSKETSNKERKSNSSKLPVYTSPNTSPLLSRSSSENQELFSSKERKSLGKTDGKTKLPKMSLFKKNW